MPTESTAEEIVERLVSDMESVLDRRDKEFAPGAIDEWRAKLLISVQKYLKEGASWPKSRPKVRLVAKDMARIAALLSGSQDYVEKAQVQAAFSAIKSHTECSANTLRGRWCDF